MEFKVGQYVIGENSISYQTGQISAMEESTGTRKGMLYKVGINWFFADEIKIDLEGIMYAFLKRLGVVRFDDMKCKFQYENMSYRLQGLCHSDYFVYLVATDDQGRVNFICTRHLKKATMNKVFTYVDGKLQIHGYWRELNMK